MPRRCLNTVQRRKVQPATVPDTSRVAGAGKVRLDELLTETITGEWGGESSPSKGVAVLRTTNFTNCGEINYDNLAWREIAKDKVERKHLCVGDIVVEKSGGTKDHPVGRVVFFDRADGLYLCNNFTQILRPDRNLIVPRFLFYTLRAKYEMRVTESMYNKTTGIQNLKMSLYMAMPIVLPPLPTQQRIADELDQLCALKKNAEDRLAILDQIVKSRFVEMFGDVVHKPKFPCKSLDEIADVGSSKRIFQSEYVQQGIPFYRSKEVVELSKGKEITTTLWISRERFEDIKAKFGVPSKGDLLVTAVGTIGQIWIVDGKSEFYYKDGNLMCIHPGTELDSVYFREALSRLIVDYKATMPQGTAYAAFTIEMARKLKLPLPPIGEQRKFSAFVAEVDKSKLTLRETVATLDQLYRAKLQECFG